jgi:nucleotide-binding universal stress UspA family protein
MVSCEEAADLLVMGGYGHSCPRELMVGGWPLVLERMTVSVLPA